ncbi:bystin [Heterostelium album PN500]|uniref:Bystin n=1 Tax=Heterostelium pallidum (strain ATCC 26659 / Pp 5 / PN500) TaxID=670386 RepID=D3AY95_HETP5|nr:bystin [Heterostelium album PN500]EFA85922.1 bystin [Heterostelium album PN500]|eukprot:XP_020438028.1 bystin [Heterostelium album PN500]
MGKIERTKKIAPRHDPLGKQIVDSENAHRVQKVRSGKGLIKKKRANEEGYEDEVEKVIPQNLSKKILSQIRDQAQEIEEEDRDQYSGAGLTTGEQERQSVKLLDFADDEEDDLGLKAGDDEEDEDELDGFGDDAQEYADFDDDIVEEIDADDERILSMFMTGQGSVGSMAGVRYTLGDLIESKLREQQERTQDPANKINPKVVDSLYRPNAFYKAIFLPLAEGGDCTLLEAKIIASVVAKVSIPVNHSAAALIKLASLDHYNGATSIFIRTLIDKKYSLPYRVISDLVRHFVNFTEERRQLPVLWHAALLTFAQRYKNDISHDQKEAIRILLRQQTHHIITHEIRRELFPTTTTTSNQPIRHQSDSKMSDI